MRVAIVSTIEEAIPPLQYGGVERIVYETAKGLGKKGCDVDLFASGDSEKHMSYRLIPIIEKSIRTISEFQDLKVREAQKFIAYSKAAKLIGERKYDIIHNNAGWKFLIFAPFVKNTILTTEHHPLNLPQQKIVYEAYRKFPYVSISNNQRNDMPHLHFVATVYNGLNLKLYPFQEHVSSQSHMFFLARLSQEKGAMEAAQVARQTNHPIIFASKIDTEESVYYKDFKQFLNSDSIQFKGEMEMNEKIDNLAHARCLLAPIQWEEPFGLMFIEAMATGTPVIAYARGAAPEIIDDGVTGFLVNQDEKHIRGTYKVQKRGLEGLCEAVERIYHMSDNDYKKMRHAARQRVQNEFTTEKMINAYLKAYQNTVQLM